VVLSADPTKVTPEEIKEIKVMLTIIDGKVEWERGD
jgi:predicted amidohydrolase YtcJ